MPKRSFEEISGYKFYRDLVQVKKIKLVHNNDATNVQRDNKNKNGYFRLKSKIDI